MNILQAILIALVAMGVWELLRRLIQYFRKVLATRDALKKILNLPGQVALYRSVVVDGNDRNIREPDARVTASVMPFLNGSPSYEDEHFSLDRPASHLLVIGSPRYNRLAELLQQRFDLPYEYVFASSSGLLLTKTLKIITEHGDELTSSRDHRATGSATEVDYGILFLGTLPDRKKVIWISGIHGVGTLGVYEYLRRYASEVLENLGQRTNRGKSWLLRVQYKVGSQGREVTNVEALGRPRECGLKRFDEVPKALVCDLGNVVMDFDRTRTYRAIAHLLDGSYEDIKTRIEGSDLRERYELGKLDDDTFCEELAQIAGDTGNKLSPELLKEFWGDIFWPNKEMFAALKALKRQGLILILLSNTNQLHFSHVVKDYPELVSLFDDTILSFQEGKTKPDTEVFELTIRRVRDHKGSVSVKDILYLDDSEQYVRKAISLGMKGFVYRSYPHFIFWLRKLGLYIP